MYEQRFSPGAITTMIVIGLATIVALPNSMKPAGLPNFLRPDAQLGLDLAGGTQLDFRISEAEIEARKAEVRAAATRARAANETQVAQAKDFELQSLEQQHQNLVEAIRSVLERRINSLGVSEATITPSSYGNEKHLLVECPGVIDVKKCSETVGKTIRLEFKEQYRGENKDYEAKTRKQIETVFQSVRFGTGNLQAVGQDLSGQLGVTYNDSLPVFVSDLPKELAFLAKASPKDPVAKTEVVSNVADEGSETGVRQVRGVFLTKILEAKRAGTKPLRDFSQALSELALRFGTGATLEEKTAVPLSSLSTLLQGTIAGMKSGDLQVIGDTGIANVLYLRGKVEAREEMNASHILVQYKGSERADASVTRTKEEAKTLIDSIKKDLAAGKDFVALAKEKSDGPSKATGGSLGVIHRGEMVPTFESAAFALKKGQISDVIETGFGFHIIRANSDVSTPPATVTFTNLKLTGAKAAEASALLEQVKTGAVTRMEDQIVVRTLSFSLEPTGWQDTELTGEHFRSASPSREPNTNQIVVQIQFDEEGGRLFHDITKRNIGKPIAIFVGGDLVSAPTVQTEINATSAVITGQFTLEQAQKLSQDLNTGAIPAPIYLSGQTTVQPTLGAAALNQSLLAGFYGFLAVAFFMILYYRGFGVIASIALGIYVILLIALVKLPLLLLSSTHIVLTLAGIAGFILSVGMAVDANVLVFERVKEEVAKGKLITTAVETGFSRAWPSIRDGNFSTLITCAILIFFGTSIIRGFGITLTLGILLSMFTAFTVSRWFIRSLVRSALIRWPSLLGIGATEVNLPPQRIE